MDEKEHSLLESTSNATKLTAVLVIVATLSISISVFLAAKGINEYQNRIDDNSDAISDHKGFLQRTESRVTVLEGKAQNTSDTLKSMQSAVNNINTWVEIQKDREIRP